MSPRVAVNRAVCELHAQCVGVAPEIFSLDDAGELLVREAIRPDEITAVTDAQFLCPTQAIALTADA